MRRTAEGVETFKEGEPIGEYVHQLTDIFGGLIECGLTIQGVQSDESVHFDEDLEPGSWLHKRSVASLHFGVLARK